MPQITVKCDYCSETFDDITTAEKHEVDCGYRPENKACYTCKHHYVCSFEFYSDECNAGGNPDKYMDENNCPKWDSK